MQIERFPFFWERCSKPARVELEGYMSWLDLEEAERELSKEAAPTNRHGCVHITALELETEQISSVVLEVDRFPVVLRFNQPFVADRPQPRGLPNDATRFDACAENARVLWVERPVALEPPILALMRTVCARRCFRGGISVLDVENVWLVLLFGRVEPRIGDGQILERVFFVARTLEKSEIMDASYTPTAYGHPLDGESELRGKFGKVVEFRQGLGLFF